MSAAAPTEAAHAAKMAEVQRWARGLADQEFADGFDVLSERSADLLDIWINDHCPCGAALMQEYHAAFVWHFASVHHCSADAAAGWSWDEATQTAQGNPCFSSLYQRKLQAAPVDAQTPHNPPAEGSPAPILYPILTSLVQAIESELATLPSHISARRTKLECLLAFSVASYGLWVRHNEACKQTWADVGAEQFDEKGQLYRPVVISARHPDRQPGAPPRAHRLSASTTRPLADPIVALRRWQAYCARVVAFANESAGAGAASPYVAPSILFPHIDKRGIFSLPPDAASEAPALKPTDIKALLLSLPIVRQLEETNACRYTDSSSFRRGGAYDAHIYARNYGERPINIQEAHRYAGKAQAEKAFSFATDLALAKDYADPPDIDGTGGFGNSQSPSAQWYRARIKVQRSIAKLAEIETQCSNELKSTGANPLESAHKLTASLQALMLPMAEYPDYILQPFVSLAQTAMGRFMETVRVTLRDMQPPFAALNSAPSSSSAASTSAAAAASASFAGPAASPAVPAATAAEDEAVEYVIPQVRSLAQLVAQWEVGHPTSTPPLPPLRDWTPDMRRPTAANPGCSTTYSGRKKVYDAYVACGATIEGFEASYGKDMSYTACLAAVRDREKAEAAAAAKAALAAKRLAKASAKKKRQLDAATAAAAA